MFVLAFLVIGPWKKNICDLFSAAGGGGERGNDDDGSDDNENDDHDNDDAERTNTTP